jgi:membrane protease YdiL (CAAX protease family)
MIASSCQPSLRDRLGGLLQDNRLVITGEVALAISFLGLNVIGVLPTEIIPFLLLGSLSLWLRRSGWRPVGMSQPTSWWRTLAFGVGVGVVFNALDLKVFLPLLEQATGQAPDLAQFDGVHGNIAVLLIWVTLTWTLGIGEEMAWRGYLFNRLADLLGRGKAGWALSLIAMALLFGLGHSYQGITGVMDAALAGILYGVLYLVSGRNLWLPVIAHGVENTTSFVLLYLGQFP